MTQTYGRSAPPPMPGADDLLSFAAMATWDHPRGTAATRILLDVGADHGVGAAVLLAGTGLAPADLGDPAREVEAGQELAVARNLVAATGDRPGLGAEAGRRYTVGVFGVWGFALLTSPTGRDLVRLGVRYAPLSFAFIHPSIEEDAREVRVVLADAEIPADVRDFLVERELAKLASLIPFALGSAAGHHVETSFDGRRAAALRAALPGADVRTGRPRHLVAFDARALDAPLPQGDPVVAAEFEAQCAALLEARRSRRGVAGRVRAIVLGNLHDPPGIAAAAAELHVSERTLRRRLAAEDTTYKALVDEVRSTMADQLLHTAHLTVAEVAARLGYHDAAGFTRAYRRWTGGTPAAARGTG